MGGRQSPRSGEKQSRRRGDEHPDRRVPGPSEGSAFKQGEVCPRRQDSEGGAGQDRERPPDPVQQNERVEVESQDALCLRSAKTSSRIRSTMDAMSTKSMAVSERSSMARPCLAERPGEAGLIAARSPSQMSG
jgi:hypothetical protein